MNKRVFQYFLLGLISFIFLAGTFSGGLWIGYLYSTNHSEFDQALPGIYSPNQQPLTTDITNTATSDEISMIFAPFWQTWDLVHQQYVDQPVDDELLMQGAIRGMLESLGDEHTGYMDPDQFQQANAPLEGEYEGIGAYVDSDTEYLTVISPIPGTPAEAAGLRPGDEIIAVDGVNMAGIDATIVLRQVLGPAGTSVTLTIRRQALDEPFDVTIVRARIVLPSVTGRMEEGNIAYIQLSAFGQTTASDLHDELDSLLFQNPQAIILDLRNNGGGYLNAAVDVASEFINEGIILSEVFGDGTTQTYEANPGGVALEIPLVVLVNGGSASASEILAGAIQDYRRGVLIGETTYGKGSVQIWTSLNNDQGAVRITVARWLTPNGLQINNIGLTPDIIIPFSLEDFDAGLDPQLERAIQYLLNGE